MFVSIFFLIFLGVVVACYFCVHTQWRPCILLIASYLFCAFLSLKALAVLVGISLLTWISGMWLERIMMDNKTGEKNGRIYLGVIISIFLLILCGHKYIPYIAVRLGMTESGEWHFLTDIVMPVGLSFYLFQAIAYLVDIYRKKEQAENNYIYLGLYLAFFVKFVSGPIERKGKFVSQLKELENVKFWDRGRLSLAFTYMLWGYFLKMVIADRLSQIVTVVFEAPGNYDSLWLVMGAVFYAVQIYCDFEGYTCIAIGCARIFGIKLTHNFRFPYRAENISDFWRRWHISLSGWLREYLYIPLGGNRRGILRKYINTMIVFVVCGMWHGTGLNYIVWGMLHGIYSIVYSIWSRCKTKIFHLKVKKKEAAKIVGRGLTFFLVTFAWIFFRSSGLRTGLAYVKSMVSAGVRPAEYIRWLTESGIGYIELAISILGVLVVGILDRGCERRKEYLPEWIQHGSNGKRYLVFYILVIVIFVFGVYGPGYRAEEFIYMQF